MNRMVVISTLVLGVAAGLAGCASSSAAAQYGGVERAMAQPTQAKACEDAGIRLVSEQEMVIPRESLPAFHTTSSLRNMQNIAVSYDVATDGKAANIRYAGNPDDFNSDARRALIRAMADHVASFSYDWEGTPAHAVGCRFTIEVGQ